jgi:hypothetical protein
MCGGSAPSGETKYNWNDDMRDRWNNTLNYSEELTAPHVQFQQYGGDRTADANWDQHNSFQYARDMATGSSSPIGSMDGARSQIVSTLGGDYLTGGKINPMAYATNSYSGESPQFAQLMNRGSQNIADNYQRGTAADTTRMFNLSGAFGGSAHQQKMATDQSVLAQQLGDYTAGMQNDQWNRSAQLAEGQLNRGSGAYENERQRMMGAIGSGQNEQGLAYQRIAGVRDAGDFLQGMNQKDLDVLFQNFQDQQNFPYKQLDYRTNIYGRAQGGVSPNQTMYQSSNGMAQGLGGLLAAYGLMSGG